MAERIRWACTGCGRSTDGRNGLDDAMDCFCPRCVDCGGLVDGAVGESGDACDCAVGDDEYWDDYEPADDDEPGRPVVAVEVRAGVL